MSEQAGCAFFLVLAIASFLVWANSTPKRR